MNSTRKTFRFLLLITLALVITSVLPTSLLTADTLVMKPSATGVTRVFMMEMREEIAPPVWRKVQKAMKSAQEEKADIILIHMNTYGGMVDAADSIRTALLQSAIPVWVFIDNNAASAGALISIACDSIYMRRGANIGAATVVDQTGKAMPDKYQSYMRAMMRSTAEAQGRDPQIAQAMVDPRISIPGLIDSTMVLTFTASEALQHGFCEGLAETVEEVMTNAGISDYIVVEQQLTSIDHIIGFLISPAISGILIMLIIGGIYFELQTPGLGFPSVVAITGALFYFAPLYLEGLAANWEILIFFVGVILVAVELFAIPGFGVAGISGIILIVGGLALSMVDNIGFDFDADALKKLLEAVMIVITATFLSILGSFWLTKKLFGGSTIFGQLALDTVMDVKSGYVAAGSEQKILTGREGLSASILRPSGKIEIDGELYDAVAETSFIEKGQPVVVIGNNNSQLIVKQIAK